MADTERTQQIDDEQDGASQAGEERAAQAPVVRLLANPRRVRRA